MAAWFWNAPGHCTMMSKHSSAELGIHALDGAKLAVEEFNAAGGVNGRRVDLVVADNGGISERAATVINKLVESDKVMIISGQVNSGPVLVGKKICQERQVPHMPCTGGTVKIIDPISPWSFTGSYNLIIWTLPATLDLMKGLGCKRPAILHDTEVYDQEISDMTVAALQKIGIPVVARENFPRAKTVDFTPQLLKIRAANPDFLFVWTGSGDGALAMKQMVQFGMKYPMVGNIAMLTPEIIKLAGDAAEGLYSVSAVDSRKASCKAFLDRFEKRFKYDVSQYYLPAASYDATRYILEALKLPGAADNRAKLRDALEGGVKGFKPVEGKEGVLWEMSPTKHTAWAGENYDWLVWMQIKGGKWVPVTPKKL